LGWLGIGVKYSVSPLECEVKAVGTRFVSGLGAWFFVFAGQAPRHAGCDQRNIEGRKPQPDASKADAPADWGKTASPPNTKIAAAT
jgi:hypothetical protein